ncbi:MAG: hypothetical protein EBT44_06665 [Actinobacteria bacterium]|uniref:HTH luxR-type domain-containing protein n=1 Tax=Candidatus Fonsibacter lacus TaxID=2576439 RepID=A0A965GDS3_9PROT|nr:hypothetical protein [Candidatus Fonsibacter lacus]
MVKTGARRLQYGNREARKVISSQIAQLAAHFVKTDLTEDQICEFLVRETLRNLEVNHVFISEITSRRTVRARASYGFDQSYFPEWQEFPLDWKLPVTDALTEERIVWINTLPEWPSDYSLLKDVTYPTPQRTQIIIPIHRFDTPVACLGVVSSRDISPDEETELLLQTIGHLISLHAYRKDRERAKKESPNVTSLTDRQVQILALITEKKTNIEIADIMGYSESTIRQETIRIFDKLQLSGRNEARKYFLENQERFGIGARKKVDIPSSREEFAH